MLKRTQRAWLAWTAGSLAALLLIQASVTGFEGPGAGTPADPYRISTVAQLQEMQAGLDVQYVLACDIDASDTATWNSGKGFTPVGSKENPFDGCLDGQGHCIRNLRIDRFGMVTTNIGLFGCTGPCAMVHNVKLEKAYVKGCDLVGALVGANSGSITFCRVSGEVYGSGTFGGLAGVNNAQGTIARCSSAVDVGPVWVGNHLGGLVGCNVGGRIENCHATGTVQGQEDPGGLVGVLYGGLILNCYATGNVKSTFSGASDAYRRGAGGLVAMCQFGGKVENCFATGQVNGPDGLPMGGLVGVCYDKASIKNSYYLNRAGAPEAGVGKAYADSGPVEWESVPRIDARFFVKDKGALGQWDFERVWNLDQSPAGTAYPQLKGAPLIP